MIDDPNKIVYLKKIEGSSEIFGKNYFNLLCATILSDRNLYEEIMKDPYTIKDRKFTLPEFYYEHDYAYPNMNYCAYQIGTTKQKMDKILRMYYAKNAEQNWFKIIRRTREATRFYFDYDIE